MVRTKMFDNIFKVIRVPLGTIANVVQSIEIDLELPRGYIAKIKKVIFALEGALSAVGDNTFTMALVRDPDDNATNIIPENEVQHDVIADAIFTVFEGTLTTGTNTSGRRRNITNFDQELDVVTARNMRFNAGGANPTPTQTRVVCEVYYTLEEVSDELVLDLLAIL